MTTSLKTLKALTNVLPPPATKILRRYRDLARRSRIIAILERSTPPQTDRAERDFEQLQREFNGVPDYGFDSHGSWKRGLERALTISELLPDRNRSYRILEVGCGEAMTGYFLSTHGHQVTVSDMDDWRDPRAKALDFCGSILERGLPYEKGTFDLIFSYNSFEHFNDPGVCFAELSRLLKPSGTIHLNFGPLYASAWGMHAYSSLMMPYPQYLFSPDFIAKKLNTTGVFDLGKRSESLQPMNQWRLKRFWDLWANPNWKIIMSDLWTPTDSLPLIIRYPECFSGRGLTYDDVAVQAITVTLKSQLSSP